jgi:hypothetical protein
MSLAFSAKIRRAAMNKIKTPAYACLSYMLLALAFAGCEQAMSGDFKGPISGSRTSLLALRPTELYEEPVDGTSIQLRWNAVEGAMGYNIYRSETLNGNGKIDENEIYKQSKETELTDTGLNPSINYYYIVKATNSINTESAGQDHPLDVRIGTEEAPTFKIEGTRITLEWTPTTA